MRGERKRRTSGGNALIFGLDFTFHAPAALSRPPYPVTATLVSLHAPDFSVMHPIAILNQTSGGFRSVAGCAALGSPDLQCAEAAMAALVFVDRF